MTTVNVHEAKTHLSSLLAVVERNGEKIIISRHGHAIAELGPISRGTRIKPDSALKKIKLSEDPTKPTQKEWEHV